MSTRPELEATLLGITRAWLTMREQMVKARAGDAAFFAANQGTHMTFLKSLIAHAAQLGGALPQMSLEELEAFRELVASWTEERKRIETPRPTQSVTVS